MRSPMSWQKAAIEVENWRSKLKSCVVKYDGGSITDTKAGSDLKMYIEGHQVRSRESFHSRADRRGEELYRLCSGAESVPRWILGVLYTSGCAIPRSGAGTRRWKLSQFARATEPDRCPGNRRLGHGAAVRAGAPGLLGDLRRPLPGSLADVVIIPAIHASRSITRDSNRLNGTCDFDCPEELFVIFAKYKYVIDDSVFIQCC